MEAVQRVVPGTTPASSENPSTPVAGSGLSIPPDQSGVSPLWSVTSCAQFLGKSPRWLWAALAKPPEEAGSIPHVRIGSTPRFFPDDIRDWARAGCPPAATFNAWREQNSRRRRR